MDLSHLYYTVLMIVGIGAIIFVHELGHYLVAKWADVKVEAFSLGFGPAIFQKQWGETVYKICWIPLGGYVKMTGENPGEETTGDPREFGAKSVGARAAIISAGVVMNIVFACMIFPVVFSLGVKMDAPIVGDVVPGMPAWVHDIRAGDRIAAVNGRHANSFEDVVFEVALSDGPLELTLDRDGKQTTVHLTPKYDAQQGFPRIGLAAPRELCVRPPKGAAVPGLEGRARVLSVNGISAEDDPQIGELIDRAKLEPIDLVLVVDRHGTRSTLRFPARMESTDTWFLGTSFPDTTTVAAVRQDPESGTRRVDLNRGDRISHVGGRPVNNAEGIKAAVLAATGPSLALTVMRGKGGAEPRELVIDLPAGAEARRALFSDVAFETGEKRSAVVPIPGFAAAAAGFRAGDRIVAVDGEETTTAEQVRARIRAYDPAKHPRGYGFTVERTVLRDGSWAAETVVLYAAPRKRPVNRALADSGLVWSPVLAEVRFPFPASIVQGIHYTKIWTFNVFKTLKRIVTGSVSPRTLGGIITIGVVTYDRAEKGLVNLLYFLAILSVNLAIINLLPIPVLDGGHLVFLLIEKVKGAPVSDRIVGVGHAIGLALILALIVFVTFNDIQRWIFP